MTSSLIDALVEQKGIESNYIDAWGEPATIKEESKKKLLRAMGYAIDNEEELISQLNQEWQSAWLRPLNPVQVNRQSDSLLTTIRLPLELVNDSYTLVVETEQGDTHTHTIVPSDAELINAEHINDMECQEYLIELPFELPLGYHTVTLNADDGEHLGDMRLIMAPVSCYHPEKIENGEKAWGLSVQLYCVRSQHNWGVGDFTDLAELVKHAANNGAQFIGLNPIHALYPANPDACSPYGPSSRRWLNFIYIDVESVEGFDDASVQAIYSNTEFQAALQTAKQAEYVDYKTVSNLKLQVLRAIFDNKYTSLVERNNKQSRAFKAFIKDGGESLEMLAVYDAIQAHLSEQGKPSWGWPVFPDNLNEFHKPAVKKFKQSHKKDVYFYFYLQWLAAKQLETANQVAKDSGMLIGLYRDLAVGVSEGSAEIWGNRDLYSTEASVGAPPDILGPLGQNWGLPPMLPEKLYEQRYQPIIDLFDANMKATGALRIDHVMALLRLWWVHKGDNAKEGGYVYYPVDDLLAILALESHRHKSLVIGEDLGTVPEEIREKLAENGVYSYRVFFFEQAEDGGFYSPSHYPVQSMSTLTTHDMPTLIGYWHCLDLALGKDIGLYPTETILSTLYHSRHQDKQRILDSLHGHHSIPEWMDRHVDHLGMSQELNYGIQKHMASGSSALLSLQLEDWLEMDKPVNIPGTFNEYPNWRRKLSKNLEDIFSDENVQQLAADLTYLRKKAGQ
ncbi:4-alpha-glucanotransferase [Aestuariibacter sp. AA17]|uniref:4-alpha-glucanotransferase n=1 Tax=Fluctibacter corallii TaxID=2984329 RepID=A0ABT3A6D6_9ALTE|nr:4-alpha-glucanotransferase [Aestuariibacter sp. AA17]MCV2884247.1 4-alpha-glucanotransferase [Aestuariibacter sp. AA17]